MEVIPNGQTGFNPLTVYHNSPVFWLGLESAISLEKYRSCTSQTRTGCGECLFKIFLKDFKGVNIPPCTRSFYGNSNNEKLLLDFKAHLRANSL